MLEVLIEVGLEGRLEGRERGFKTERKWEGIPDMWAIGRERARAEGREFGEGCAGGEGQMLSEDSGWGI